MNTVTLQGQIDQVTHNLNAIRAYQSHWTRQDRQLEARYMAQLSDLEAQLPLAYFEQLPYVANDDMPVAELTTLQSAMMGEQINYWYERLDQAIDKANHEECELCAAYIIAMEAIVGVA